MPRLLILVKKQWFLIGVLCSILLAEVYPSLGASGGPLKPEWTVKYVAVTIVFFLSGLSLTPNEITSAASRIKVHLFIQIFTFIFVPVFVLVVNSLLRYTFSINEWILKGLATASCMPPPISSAVILTRAVGGSEAVAVINSVIGSFIGLLITPFVIFLILGTTAVVSFTSNVQTHIETVMIPFGVGQLVHAAGFFKFLHKRMPYMDVNMKISNVGQLTLLFIIYTTFCDAFLTHDIPMNASDVLLTVVLVLLIQMMILYGSFEAANRMKSNLRNLYKPNEIVAMTFCCTHKSLTLGIPILRILFSGYSHFSQITLPLLLYHPTQIILGGLLVPYLKKWLTRISNETKLLM